ncbi:sensor histidine kinase [Pedobacter flavus]|uniref:histidine kinase n=1 Tax=Pedobacter flavus TaxID=3113906 RepID=A0ABU7GYF4_9SPHI|nr:HAMP domain-containing sensor histidine kinase [Pedobacter sp. VNH31]MEE1884105.1 HAMP domain-containing sensor histidine kinase [Pedobacter sp. VNH31]
MKKEQNFGFRKNFSLIVIFIALISTFFVLSLFVAFNYSKKVVENEYVSEKINVLEHSMAPYNDFFQNKLTEISFYNGYLDSLNASKYIDSVLLSYPFVEKVTFYDAEVKNSPIADGLTFGNFSLGPKASYDYSKLNVKTSVTVSKNIGDEFRELALKVTNYLSHLDTAKVPSQDELFTVFTSVRSNKITYLNIPQFDDLKAYKQLLRKVEMPPVVFQQDMLSFDLNPDNIKILNIRPKLYQNIEIRPITYDPLSKKLDNISTEVTLPGPFSDYKLYFTSSKTFINYAILREFMPLSLILLLIYGVLLLVAYLIFRNLNINQKMYKLQYDFVNNLTHEFKTPVSVIKIAGNNIKSSPSISAQEQKFYGRILDEEADKLNGLMNKLLSFTQIENRVITLNEEEVNIREFIESTIESHKLKHPDFDFTYELIGKETIITDPVLLGSLFDNLAENAYKYSSPDKKKLKISAKLSKNKAEFKFTDSGIGIPSSEINNIFKKFYRIQNQYNQNGSVGLGLAFCKELVDFMKGEISVKSKVGEGSEFLIVLPFN